MSHQPTSLAQERSISAAPDASSAPPGLVLVTGAGGFIGSHLVEDQLRRGARVRAMDLHLEALDHVVDDRLERIQRDVTDASSLDAAVAGVEVVFHLASKHLE